jgi:RNA polymerase sigma-32 factor
MIEPGLFEPLQNAMKTAAVASNELAVRDPWALVPPIGNLDAYISAIHRIPLLTPQQEADFARRLRDSGDLEAAGRMVLSHLRLVVSVSRQYLGYGLPQGDLIQEGNVGLMKAVKRFDPEQGVRLVSYALHWIRAEIHEYILKNWRMVKVATTKAQRKLFFNLRSMKQGMKAAAADGDTHRGTLSPSEVDSVARQLNVKREEVLEMETRMSGGDIALEPQTSDDGEESYAPIAYLADEANEPTRVLEARSRDELAGDGISRALEVLDARSRRIVEERWLKVNDDSSGGMTLHDLAAEYGVSAERIRQIEVAAMKKMRGALQEAY